MRSLTYGFCVPWTAFDAELVAAAVRTLRTESRWTQAELAERAGLAFETISRIESGREPPSLRTAMLLANAFERPLDAVVGRTSSNASNHRSALEQRKELLRELMEHARELPLDVLEDLVRLAGSVSRLKNSPRRR